MGLGILEDTKLDHVPGTTYVLEDQTSPSDPATIDPNLRYDRSGPVPIILVPQPSDDPNDPLNWPLWKRDVILGVLSLVAVVCASASSLLAANTVRISIYFRRNFTKTALLTGYHLCGVGVAGLLCVPTARIWGKRHLFILGTIFVMFSSAWGGSCRKIIAEGRDDYVSLLWARIFQGIGLAPFEALVNAAVGDLYFVHERGKRMALSNVAVFGGAFLTPVIVGKLTSTMGWMWSFYLLAIFSGAGVLLIIFFVPETTYRRATHLNTDYEGDAERRNLPSNAANEGPASATHSSEQERSELDKEKPQPPSTDGDVAATEAQNAQPRKASYWQSLKPFNGRKTDEKFLKLLLRPFPLFLYPSILWACLVQGVLIGWTVFIGVVLAVVFMTPPLWFSEVETGYTYAGAFIGAIIGLVLSGLLSDWSAKVMIRWNKGKYEPEFRIVLVFPQLLFSSIGMYGLAWFAADVWRYRWLPSVIMFAFVLIGMVMGAVASALYVVDAHRQIAVEAFTCLLVFKNIFSFVMTYFAYDWLVAAGPRTVFLVIASIQVGVCLLSVPMYIFGKRNRSFCHRHDILKKLHLW
ncbi:hypothetical protein VTO42DRAFT_3913 [Malbranchea cinnamomea]